MTIDELRDRFPKVYQEAFAQGFNAGVKCQFSERSNASEQRRLEAAELIVNPGRDRAPVGFARVDGHGQAFVVPTF
jgi:hypothetical protein